MGLTRSEEAFPDAISLPFMAARGFERSVATRPGSGDAGGMFVGGGDGIATTRLGQESRIAAIAGAVRET
jgi:hypothetical protein